MTDTVAALELDGVTYSFGDKVAVDDLSLSVRAGEVYGLLGPNGAGKTTTLRLLVTLLKPQSGSISIFGTDVQRFPPKVRRDLGYVPQGLSADGTLTCRQNVSLFARLFDVPRRERKERVAETLDALGLLEVADRQANTLSGGMLRRLELAQALISRPRLLVLDEPTVGLDPIARDQLWQQIRRLRDDTGATVLVTTHYMEEADALCDTIALMHRGSLRITGSPAELKAGIGEQASLDDVFRHYAGETLDDEGGDFRSTRTARRTARRLG